MHNGKKCATVAALLLAAISLSATDRVDCGCPKTGGYLNPLRGAAPAVVPTSFNTGTSPNGVYRVTSTGQGSLVYVSVERVASGAILLQQSVPTPASWGFSPDDDRFVLQYPTGVGSTHNVFLYNLAGNTPNQPISSFAQSTGSARTIFSPSGRYFFYGAITAPSHALFNIVQATSGTLAFQSEFTFSSPPGSPGDSYGSVRWGFSPDSHDRTFVYAWVSGPNSVEFSMVNLETNLASGASSAAVHNETILDISAFWQFSPCGDVLGLARQPNLNQARIHLRRTIDGARLAGPHEDFPFAAVSIRSSASSHIANVGGTDYVMANNSAGAPCSNPPVNQPPVAAFNFPPIIRAYIETAFTDQSSDPDGSIVLRLWSFDDGTSSSQQNPTHVFSAGSYNVRLQVFDNQGESDTIVRTITVLPNEPPRASFTFAPTNAAARDIVTFTDTSVDDDGITQRYWSIGSSDPVVQHKVCGNVDVSLTVYDGAFQSDTITHTIRVSAPANPVIFVSANGSLMAAIELACPGDVIQLEAGTYTGGVRLGDLTLQGAGPGQTIISGVGTNEIGNEGWVLWSDPSDGSTNTIRDLTITGGGSGSGWDAQGGGLYVRTFQQAWTSGINLDISRNEGFGGVYAYGNSGNFELRNSTVTSNRNMGNFGAAGITIGCCGIPIIKDCEIAFNVSTNGEGDALAGGITVPESPRVIFIRNHVHHNVTSGNGGGLAINSYRGTDLIAHNRFTENSAAKGGGLFVWGGDRVLFVGNLVAGNTGGGIFDDFYPSPDYPSPVTVVNSTIMDNIGPGIVTGDQGTNAFLGASILNSIIAGNITEVVGSPSTNSSHSLIGNAPPFRGAGDYHLLPGPGAVDAGDNALLPQASNFPDLLEFEPDLAAILARDADADPRMLDGDGDGAATIDIGYDEFAEPLLRLRIERLGNDVVVFWTPPDATLQEVRNLGDPWQDLSPLATTPHVVSSPTGSRFYRLRR